MPKRERRRLRVPRGYRSRDVALLVAALDDLTRILFDEDLEKISTAELAWQSAPGHNTIGMLLAHLAVVEVYWTQVGAERRVEADIPRVIGIGMDDDGIPLEADGQPPANLRGKSLRWYRHLLEKARRHIRPRWKKMSDADLVRPFTRVRKNGDTVVIDPRWVIYHVIEHFAAHQGQINLIRHQYRDAGKKA